MEGEAGDEVTGDIDGEAKGPAVRLLRRVVDVRAGELRALLASFTLFFFLLSSYFVLRPMRDEVAASSGVNGLTWLFAATLAGTLVFNPMFSALVVRFPVRKFIPISYQFFVANMLIFYAVLRYMSAAEGSSVDVWAGRAFFIWTTVFALFNTSIFWCLMADTFRSDEAKRLFGFIGVGGTLGSIAGSAATAALAQRVGTMNLLIVSAVLLEIGVLVVMRFPRRAVIAPDERVRSKRDQDRELIGGSVWAGFTHVVRSPYLLGICGFMVLFTVGSTFLYFAQSDLVGREFADKASRTAVLAKLELSVQTLTVITQIFFTGRIIRWLGLGLALALLPIISILGFGGLALVPAFGTIAVFTVLRRGGNFAITNPAMEVLFTVVRREDKYKAKNVIETFVYRGGDQIGAWAYKGLTGLGLGLVGISSVAVPLSMIWLGLGLWLGRRQAQLAGEQPVVKELSAAVPVAT
ncbi:MAG TPA: MFS transporter [Gemmatimonadaceae bacterium]|nr:MFS transporter [Gemmatimonadaceae bacterium]